MSSRGRGGDRYLVVAVVNLDNFSVLEDMAGVAAANRARVAVGQRLRETVRRVALIAHVTDSEFFIADVFTSDAPYPLVERVRGTIASSPGRLTASIGVVSTPLSPLVGQPPYDVLEEVLSIATEAMYQARRDGGNRAHQVRSRALTVLDLPAAAWATNSRLSFGIDNLLESSLPNRLAISTASSRLTATGISGQNATSYAAKRRIS